MYDIYYFNGTTSNVPDDQQRRMNHNKNLQ
jgi:hypothetical protein